MKVFLFHLLSQIYFQEFLFQLLNNLLNNLVQLTEMQQLALQKHSPKLFIFLAVMLGLILSISLTT